MAHCAECDSETYNSEGPFRPQPFNDTIAKYAQNGAGAHVLRELFELMHGKDSAADPFEASVSNGRHRN